MKALYIFPHPDDESFGPAAAIARQRRQGHGISLLTLTRGGATKQRHKFGYSVEEMGNVRYREMQAVAEVLGLDTMVVLDYPDSGLKEIDPRPLEKAVESVIRDIEPDVIVTYPVHGISGFHDHLVTHAVVKRVFLEMREGGGYRPRRLAFFTIGERTARATSHFKLNFSTMDDIDCAVPVDAEDAALMRRALDCYETYREVIEATGIGEIIGDEVYYELFQERFATKLTDLFEHLPDRQDGIEREPSY